jgi:Rps23 Pro-64 3,4-dihydroxylase Tpa1-like proline 4-hydroxylase
METNERVIEGLRARAEELRREWSAKQPFRYVVIDDLLPRSFAEEILASYPTPEAGGWDGTTYIHQRKKLTQTSNFAPPIARFFALTAAGEFRRLVSDICGIPDLLDDPELLGGGLHQTMRGGFLDVHVDYNFHPRTKLHRRLNLLLYLNKDWRPEYQGHLELWDMGSNRRLESIAPVFNRGVIFETNEVSYHGHPQPLNTPPGVTRKSLAIYYYTERRDDEAASAPEHNTLYRQTTGAGGYAKTIISAAQAAAERAAGQGVGSVGSNLIRKLRRRARGLPPENKAD